MLLQRMLLQWGGKGGGGRGSINKREIGALGGSRCIAIIDSGGGIRDFSCRLLPKCSSSTKRLSSDVLKRSSAFFSYISILVRSRSWKSSYGLPGVSVWRVVPVMVSTCLFVHSMRWGPISKERRWVNV